MDVIEFFAEPEDPNEFSTRYVNKSYLLINRIRSRMKDLNWDQKDLAIELNKNESEVSKWLAGFHNFTLKSLMKIEEALKCDLIEISDDSHIVEESFEALPKDSVYRGGLDHAVVFEASPPKEAIQHYEMEGEAAYEK